MTPCSGDAELGRRRREGSAADDGDQQAHQVEGVELVVTRGVAYCVLLGMNVLLVCLIISSWPGFIVAAMPLRSREDDEQDTGRQLPLRASRIAAQEPGRAGPLTHNMSGAGGDPGQAELDWLARCARGGFGLLIAAATQVQPGGAAGRGSLP